MIKKLLIGASALAVASTANAQVVPAGVLDTVTPVEISTQKSPPVTAAEEGAFDNALRNGDFNDARSIFATPGPVGSYYITQVSASGNVPSLADAGNKAAVDQDGNDNASVIDQQGGRNGWAAVKQLGNNNRSDIDQNDTNGGTQASENAAYVQQVSAGTAAAGTFIQNAEINQNRDDPNNPRMNAAILQGGIDGGVAGRGNSARIDQQGTGHDAVIVQGARATANEQNNYAYILQDRNSSQSSLNRAGIQQSANGNAQIFQRGSAESTAYIVQSTGSSLDSDIFQVGYGNQAYNFQEVGVSGTADSFIDQRGGGNQAYVTQSGNLLNGVSELFQNGQINFAVTEQTVATDAISRVSQTGDFNSSIVRQ